MRRRVGDTSTPNLLTKSEKSAQELINTSGRFSMSLFDFETCQLFASAAFLCIVCFINLRIIFLKRVRLAHVGWL